VGESVEGLEEGATTGGDAGGFGATDASGALDYDRVYGIPLSPMSF